MIATRILEYQKEANVKIKSACEWKEVGIRLRDEFLLTDREAIDLLNNKNILLIISKIENN